MHKETISALMDGEALDSAVLHHLERDDSLQQTWESYHLIRDVLRGDAGSTLHFDITSRVMAAIAAEPARLAEAVPPLIPESQPEPHQWLWWNKLRPWSWQVSQVAVAACVSLAVIIGVQHYHAMTDNSPGSETPVFSTLPMIGQASPVSLGVPSAGSAGQGDQLQRMQEQHRYAGALLQDYELQRRLYSERLKPESLRQAAQDAASATDNKGIQVP